jgi:hypothetical protein
VEEAQARLDARPQRVESCRVALQLPDKRIVHSFAEQDTVQSVYDVATTSLPDGKATSAFQLVVNSTAGQPLTDMNATVAEAALPGSLLRLAWL